MCIHAYSIQPATFLNSLFSNAASGIETLICLQNVVASFYCDVTPFVFLTSRTGLPGCNYWLDSCFLPVEVNYFKILKYYLPLGKSVLHYLS